MPIKPRHDNHYQPPCFDDFPDYNPNPEIDARRPLVVVHALSVRQEAKKMNLNQIAAISLCVCAAYRADCAEPIDWKAIPQERALEKLRSLKVEKASFPKETLEERIKKIQVYGAPFGLKVSLEPGTNKNRELYAFELPPGPFVLLLKYTCGDYNLASRLTNGGIVFFDQRGLKTKK